MTEAKEVEDVKEAEERQSLPAPASRGRSCLLRFLNVKLFGGMSALPTIPGSTGRNSGQLGVSPELHGLFEFVEIVFRFYRLSVRQHDFDRRAAVRELLGVEPQKNLA
jgi:hypothetical protein